MSQLRNLEILHLYLLAVHWPGQFGIWKFILSDWHPSCKKEKINETNPFFVPLLDLYERKKRIGYSMFGMCQNLKSRGGLERKYPAIDLEIEVRRKN